MCTQNPEIIGFNENWMKVEFNLKPLEKWD